MKLRNIFLSVLLFTTLICVNVSSKALEDSKNKSIHGLSSRQIQPADDNWVLELRGDKWWWVLYDEDGLIIIEYPVDL